ncbi:hypothetical protein GQF42_40845 [Streptomyces broussonetiae]|uniref:Uncharacterized protein n=1 Tax=Streptomyces broussonetiae TaxID=2686304 RepID=A0A6I6NQ97_9ACTN|nr:hypothetical protein GQF42_40845 [Streptomyces broussonetiae]
MRPASRPAFLGDRAADAFSPTRSTASASHPFSTGTARVVETAGRVGRFERRHGRAATTPRGRRRPGPSVRGRGGVVQRSSRKVTWRPATGSYLRRTSRSGSLRRFFRVT